ATDVLERRRLDRETVELRGRPLRLVGAEAVVGYAAVVDTDERRRALGPGVDVAVLTDEGLGVLVDLRDADRDTHANVATGEARRDLQQFRRVLRGDEDVVSGDDRGARGRVVAGLPVVRPQAHARERVRLQQGHGEGAGDADRAAAGARDDRDDRFLAGGADLDVPRRVH